MRVWTRLWEMEIKKGKQNATYKFLAFLMGLFFHHILDIVAKKTKFTLGHFMDSR